jgi:hypothetical protein
MKISQDEIKARLDLFDEEVAEYGAYNLEDEVTRAIIFELALESLGYSPENILSTLEVKQS